MIKKRNLSQLMFISTMAIAIFVVICLLAACSAPKACVEQCVSSADNVPLCKQVCGNDTYKEDER